MSWTSNPKRNGNDEIPTDRVAVKIIRSTRAVESPRSPRTSHSPPKQPVTKISRLVYEAKRQPTAALVKSIHSYKVYPPQNGPGDNPKRQRTANAKKQESNGRRHPRETVLTDNQTHPASNQAIVRPAFEAHCVQKRLELHKEIGEIHDILRGLADERPDQEPSVLANQKHSNLPAESNIPDRNRRVTESRAHRNKTDPHLPGRGRSKANSTTNSNAGTDRKNSARSKSSTNARSHRSDAIATSMPKQKSYDAEKARQYMEEQKERRRAAADAAKKSTSKVDRGEIKKRLENLRKNTLSILQKNVEKARKVSVDSKPTLLNGDEQAEQHFESRNNPHSFMPTPRRQLILNQPSSPSANAFPATIQSPKRTKSGTRKKLASKKTEPLQPSDFNIDLEPSKRPKKIGLLRKPEADLFNQPNLIDTLDPEPNKENLLLFPSYVEQCEKVLAPSPPALPANIPIDIQQASVELGEKLPDLELNIPDVQLKSKSQPAVAEKSTQAEPLLPPKSTLPYWLQPTPVQLYPYNFIKAVRKKLEAITNPVLSTKDQQTETDLAPALTTILDRTQQRITAGSLTMPAAARRRLLSRPGLNEVSSVNLEPVSGHKLSSASSVFTPFLNSPALTSKRANSPSLGDSAKPPPMPPPPAQEHSKSLSEITSSITLNVPASNTVSEVSSIHSEIVKQPLLSSTHVSKKIIISKRHKNDEDTTASSSVFSSPEKRLTAPKHVQQVSNKETGADSDLHLPSNNDDELKHLSPLSVDKINNLTLKLKSSSTSQAEVKTREDFEKMLVDFNKSLSHVIEVNEKLQCALSKSPQSRSSKSTAENVQSSESVAKSRSQPECASLRCEGYSSDFEKSNSSKTGSDFAKAESKSSEIPRGGRSGSTTLSINTESGQNASGEQKRTTQTGCSEPSAVTPVNRIDDSVKNISNYTEDFPDSIEEASRSYMKIFLSPNQQQELQDSNNFSRDSLELNKEHVINSDEHITAASKEAIIRNQINVRRGDSYDSVQKHCDVLTTETDLIKISDEAATQRPALNSSIGSDIFTIFKQTEMELSIISQNSRVSESQLNYSTLGLYEQLIRTEAIKTEHLSALLKIREKSILDRTRGQIALLEIQKEKCKAKGLPVQISMIKRKQRAILMKMEKEREEIKRVLRLSEKSSDPSKPNTSALRVPPKIPELPASLDISFRRNLKQFGQTMHDTRAIVRGYELDMNSTQNLETLLEDREKELRRRRDHVERLLRWHQRLDQEEDEVLRIEQMLYSYNQQKQRSKQPTDHAQPIEDGRKQKKLMEIDKSLRELQSIETNSGSEPGTGKKPSSECVRTSGRKLNKLWRRLTGRKELRFEHVKKYKLQKGDLEKLYEDAKLAVLADFQENDHIGILTDPSKCNDSTNSLPAVNSIQPSKETVIPNLNLNFSSDPSELDNLLSEKIVDNEALSKTENDDGNTTSAADVSLFDEHLKTSDFEYTTNFTSSQNSSTGMVCASDLTIDSCYYVPAKTNNAKCEANFQMVNSEATTKLTTAVNTQRNTPNDISTPDDLNLTEKEKQEDFSESNVIQADTAPTPKSDSCEFEVAIDDFPLTPTASEKILIPENPKEASFFFSKDTPMVYCLADFVDKNNDSCTMIADISAPKFETTVEDTIAEEVTSEELNIEVQLETSTNSNSVVDQEKTLNKSDEDCGGEKSPSKLEKRLNDLEQSLIDLNNSFERVLSPEVNTFSAHIAINVEHIEDFVNDEKVLDATDSSSTKMTVKDFLLHPDATSNLMPDIINEVELRRRQQILADSDIIQLENAVPYALLREIPNKPPPPYVPPAHGSPMTTIFPTECRIKDITFRRTSELYEEFIEKGNSTSLQACILDENITNIYERIILDICRECVRDYQPTFSASLVVVGNYKMPLALYNPPNRLKCIQEFVYKRVRKLLNLEKRPPRPNSIFSLGRRKRDHVDEILIQELYEEEHKWTNFDLEEDEVKESVVDEVFQELVKEIIDDFEESYQCKEISKSANQKLNACETGACSAESMKGSDQDVCRE